jgi:hypothetical protein
MDRPGHQQNGLPSDLTITIKKDKKTMRTKRKSAKVKVHKFPKGYHKLIERIGMLKMVRDVCRELGLQLRPETKEERASRTRIEGGRPAMITLANALTAALAYLQTQGEGHTITIPSSAWSKVPESIEVWCMRRSLIHSQEGRFVTLEIDTTAGL